MSSSLAVVDWIVTNLVDDVDAVEIIEAEDPDGTLVYEVQVAPDDMGRLIGRRGRTAKAIRTIVSAISDEPVNIDIIG
ncbi:KH domain-containing protein [Stomatohabitans albus]|uniref:KH domain-containing protein n=1 Tax=Stomatohabitans albus TaxID=3110766 RepID=UPI00300D0C0B